MRRKKRRKRRRTRRRNEDPLSAYELLIHVLDRRSAPLVNKDVGIICCLHQGKHGAGFWFRPRGLRSAGVCQNPAQCELLNTAEINKQLDRNDH